MKAMNSATRTPRFTASVLFKLALAIEQFAERCGLDTDVHKIWRVPDNILRPIESQRGFLNYSENFDYGIAALS
jgi:hypothetical protein